MRTLLFLLLLLHIAVPAGAQPQPRVTSADTPQGPVIEFMEGDFMTVNGLSASGGGWVRARTPRIHRLRETGWRTGDYHSLIGRFRFDRRELGGVPLAMYMVGTRNQFSVTLNGVEIGRNYAHVSDQILAWYRPYLIPIPAEVLKGGINELRVRAISQESVGIGRLSIGPNVPVRQNYETQFFWQITAPMAANFAMLALGALALLLWFGRRHETELLWLSLSTLLWFLRNYQYFAESTPFDMAVFNALTVYATYYASVATAAFYFWFTKLPHRRRIIAALFALGVPLATAHTVFGASNLVFYIPTTLLIFGIAFQAMRDLWRRRDVEHGVIGLAMVTMPITSLHDVAVAGWSRGWDGNNFYISVFGGFLYCIAFLISFGQRAVDAFRGLGDANTLLEQRIDETRAELALSEAARQELVVGHAIAGERERLMQEMHDGIGSNLITALAIAQQQQQPLSTIKTLRRALADLKQTVDSLEPVEGDLVALIGNLRHRMAGDLRDAGIVCRWEVQNCGPLTWLDATNALHVLRIFQEIIGNVLAHSEATEMRIGCREEARARGVGITAYVSDNGRGFDAATIDPSAKGLASIRARARSLHGVVDHQTAPGVGTCVTIWLPYTRRMPAAAAI